MIIKKETSMIKLIDISKYYKSGFNNAFVLRDIDLEIDEGEFVNIGSS